MARNDPPVDREQYLEGATGETARGKQFEGLDVQEEGQPRRDGPAAPGGRPGTVTPGRRRASPGPVAEAGADDHRVPHGIAHVGPDPVQRQALHPKVPAPYYSGDMAHGVPQEGPYPNEGAIAPVWTARHGHETDRVRHEPPEIEPDPVPVYVVERAGGGTGRMDTATDVRVAPAAGSDPVRLTSEDLRRARVALLNETPDKAARFSKSLADLAQGKGAKLPANATSYLWLRTQDDLFAVSADSTPITISVIQEYELPGGGG